MIHRDQRQAGFSLVEVLISLAILAIGILGIAGLQARAHQLEIESYQRATALSLVQDMVSRVNVNRKAVDDYVAITADGVGVGKAPAGVNCTPPVAERADADVCEWDALLEGAAMTNAGGSVGILPSAVGCVTALPLVVPVPPAPPIPPSYRVEVVWSGPTTGAVPADDVVCGAGIAKRRAMILTLSIGDLDG